VVKSKRLYWLPWEKAKRVERSKKELKSFRRWHKEAKIAWKETVMAKNQKITSF